jgi:hypothetical protein
LQILRILRAKKARQLAQTVGARTTADVVGLRSLKARQHNLRTATLADIMSITLEQNPGEQASERTADDPDAKRFHDLPSP